MLVVLTGLHASGKSYFANNIAKGFGFNVVYKLDIVKKLSDKEKKDFRIWYRENFNKDPYSTTEKILSELPLSENVILDSVHSFNEWRIIQSIVPDVVMISVITPECVRTARYENPDDNNDNKRLMYWHSDFNGERGCLLSQASWSINGAASLEANRAAFEDFLNFYKVNYNKASQNVRTRTNEERKAN